jgi:hypothetical protein
MEKIIFMFTVFDPTSEASSSLSSQALSPSYRLLGLLKAFQAAFHITSAIYPHSQVETNSISSEDDPSQSKSQSEVTIDGIPVSDMLLEENEADEDESVDQNKRCTLCLGKKRDPTVTECGHVCKSFL